MTSPAYRVAMEAAHVLAIVGGPHQIWPVPGWPTALSLSLDAGFYLASNDCDGEEAACSWRERTLHDLDILRDQRVRFVVEAAGGGAIYPIVEPLYAALQNAATFCDDGGNVEPDDGDPTTGPVLPLLPLTPVNRALPNADIVRDAYIDAAQAAYEVHGETVNLRPWLALQIPVDIDMRNRDLALRMAQGAARPADRERTQGDILYLQGVLEHVLDRPEGAWSSGTVLRVLEDPSIPGPYPVVDDNDGGDSPQQGGGGFGAVLALGIPALLLLK